jgi:hypothetical protein
MGPGLRLASTRRQKVLCLFGVCALSALLGRVDATDPPPPGASDLPTCGFSDVVRVFSARSSVRSTTTFAFADALTEYDRLQGCSNANGAKQTCACFAVAGVNFFNCDEQSSECSPWTIYTAGCGARPPPPPRTQAPHAHTHPHTHRALHHTTHLHTCITTFLVPLTSLMQGRRGWLRWRLVLLFLRR